MKWARSPPGKRGEAHDRQQRGHARSHAALAFADAGARSVSRRDNSLTKIMDDRWSQTQITLT
jgi:hypothetical protein